MKYLWCVALLIKALDGLAQPGDRDFQLLLFDHGALVDCSTDSSFTLLSARAIYTNTPRDYTPVPPDKAFFSNGRLTCKEDLSPNPQLQTPHRFYYNYPSSLSTTWVIIVKDKTDTMFFANDHGYIYSRLMYPSGSSVAVPFVLEFRKGTFGFSELRHDESRLKLHDAFFAEYLTRTEHLHRVGKSPEPVVVPPITIAPEKQSKPNTKPADTLVSYKLNKETYYEHDAITVVVTGNVMLQGDCGNNHIVWTLQKQANDDWQTVTDLCCGQMDCGLPFMTVFNKSFVVTLINGRKGDEMPRVDTLGGGRYRVGVYDRRAQPIWSEPFNIVVD